MRWARAGWRMFADTLRDGGVEVVQALPMRSLMAVLKSKSARLDQRNHRKIMAVDGSIGYIGSQNVIDAESMPGLPNEELVARVTGPAAAAAYADLPRYLPIGGFVAVDVTTRPVARGRAGSHAKARGHRESAGASRLNALPRTPTPSPASSSAWAECALPVPRHRRRDRSRSYRPTASTRAALPARPAPAPRTAA